MRKGVSTEIRRPITIRRAVKVTNAMLEESNLARFDATVPLYTDQIVLKHFAHHTFLIYAIVQIAIYRQTFISL